MKWYCIPILLVTLGFSLTYAGEEPSEAAFEAMKLYDKAIRSQDAGLFRKVLSDDYELVEWDGQVFTKSHMVEDAEAGRIKFKVAESSEDEYRVYGDAIVWTGVWHESGTDDGEPFENAGRFTTVMTKQDGRWQVVSDQVTRFADGAKATPWKWATGEWKYEDSSGRQETVVWEKFGEHALVGTWKTRDGRATEVVGWKPESSIIQATGFDEAGGHWDVQFTKVTATQCRGSVIARTADGQIMKGEYVLKKVGNDKMTTRFQGKQDGKKVVVEGTFVRVE